MLFINPPLANQNDDPKSRKEILELHRYAYQLLSEKANKLLQVCCCFDAELFPVELIQKWCENQSPKINFFTAFNELVTAKLVEEEAGFYRLTCLIADEIKKYTNLTEKAEIYGQLIKFFTEMFDDGPSTEVLLRNIKLKSIAYKLIAFAEEQDFLQDNSNKIEAITGNQLATSVIINMALINNVITCVCIR